MVSLRLYPLRGRLFVLETAKVVMLGDEGPSPAETRQGRDISIVKNKNFVR